jgi:hypothetical protein
VAIISATMVPANEVVAKLLIDLIGFLLLLVCRLKAAGIDIPLNFFANHSGYRLLFARDGGASQTLVHGPTKSEWDCSSCNRPGHTRSQSVILR